MTFATRFRAWPVLIGITIATTVVHAVSAGIGYGLGASLPTDFVRAAGLAPLHWIALIAGAAALFAALGARLIVDAVGQLTSA